MRQYELVFVTEPLLDEGSLDALIARVQQYAEREGGQVSKIERWGLRRLAYPIQHHWEGHYVLMHFAMEPGGVNTFDRSLRFTEGIMRHLIVLRDESISEPS